MLIYCDHDYTYYSFDCHSSNMVCTVEPMKFEFFGIVFICLPRSPKTSAGGLPFSKANEQLMSCGACSATACAPGSTTSRASEAATRSQVSRQISRQVSSQASRPT